MPEVSNLFVCVMGMSVTFIGLSFLILLTVLMGKIVNKKQTNKISSNPEVPVSSPGNRQEIIAAVAACIAEDLGTDVSAIRILSFKKVS